MAFTLPPLKLSQLKYLAFQCGIPASGTKSVLSTRLIHAIQSSHDHRNDKKRVLSIDMGIRNLAYCVLDQSQRAAQIPSVVAWKRIAVSSKPVDDLDSATPAPKESFAPADFAAHAYNLLRHTLLPFNPTHILIERQRFRSLGSPHILEWTIRVNMLESMLYAVLHTLSEEKIWVGTVEAITPGRVGPYWVGTGFEGHDGELKKKRSTASIKAQNKGAKIDLVQTWLSNHEMVRLKTEEAKATAQLYMEKWHRGLGRPKGTVTKGTDAEEVRKLDDLADSLLQGRAWIEWYHKKQSILKHGVDIDSLEREGLRTLPVVSQQNQGTSLYAHSESDSPQSKARAPTMTSEL